MNRDLSSLLHSSADEVPEPSPTLVEDGIRRGRVLQRRRFATSAGGAAAVVATIVVLVLALGNLGPNEGGATPDPAEDRDDLPVLMEDGEVLVSCGGGPAWRPSVMASGVASPLTDAEAERTFQAILDDPELGGEASLSLFPDGVDVEWRVLAVDGDRLAVGLGRWTEEGPAQGAALLGLERDGDAWVADGWSGCGILAPVLREPNAWVWVVGSDPPAPGAASVTVRVNELQCTGSRDPEPYLHDPVVVESPEAVTLYWTTTPFVGEATCPGNPVVTRTVELDAPLGERALLDGSRYPPEPVPQD